MKHREKLFQSRRRFHCLIVMVACAFGVAMIDAQSIEPSSTGDRFKIQFDALQIRPGSVSAFVVNETQMVPTPTQVQGTSTIVVEASLTNVVVAQAEAKKASGVTVLCARWQPAQSKSKAFLPLDLVPSEVFGEVRAFFQGKALPRAKAIFRMPSGDLHDLVADAEGYFRFRTTRPGRYILSMTQASEQAGGTNYQASVAWSQQ